MIRIMIILVSLASLLFASGCRPMYIFEKTKYYAEAFKLIAQSDVRRNNHRILAHDTRLYVAIPTGMALGDYDRTLAGWLESQFELYASYVLKGRQVESLPRAVQTAASKGLDYVLYGRLLIWENHIGSWREFEESPDISAVGRDRIQLRILLVEVPSADIVDVVAISGRSGILTFLGDQPGDLAFEPIDQFARSLFPRGVEFPLD